MEKAIGHATEYQHLCVTDSRKIAVIAIKLFIIGFTVLTRITGGFIACVSFLPVLQGVAYAQRHSNKHSDTRPCDKSGNNGDRAKSNATRTVGYRRALLKLERVWMSGQPIIGAGARVD